MLAKEDNLFQSQVWSRFQAQLPQREVGFVAEGKAEVFYVVMPSVFGQRYLYVSRGLYEEEISSLWPQILAIAREKNCLYIKWEPPFERVESDLISKMQLRKSNFHIQPEATLMLDLTLNEEELLRQMKSKGRYNIKISKKHEISYRVYQADDSDLEVGLQEFYQLLQTTAERDQFGVHDKDYYQLLLNTLDRHSKLYLAYYQDKPVAALIATFYGKMATYYYGASSNQYRNTMATYGIQWRAIRDAKAAGCQQYDFFGISPPVSSASHPWQGVTQFKKKFGGQVYCYSGTYHHILKPFTYFCLNAVKKIYKFGSKIKKIFK